MRPCFLRAAAAALSCTLAFTSAAAERPRVGLVLGGGGARGAAHIGLLEVLEELRVPVDCVAGTSMGALVAGAWAAGLSPAQMREQLGHADWADLFSDEPVYGELSFRSKRLSQRFLPGSESLWRLIAWVRNYVGDELLWDFNPILKREEVPPLVLGEGTRLGWTTWLTSRPLDRDADDLKLDAVTYCT